MFFVTSCEKNESAPRIEEASLFSSEKRLSFESEEEFYGALQQFVDTEDRNVDYEQDILPWEEEQAFTSMRREYEYLNSKFDNLASEAELGAFASTYTDWVTYSNGSYQIDPVLGTALMNILTPEGTVEIADALYKYTPNTIYIILDKDEAKLAQAVNTGESNEDEGVFLINGWRKSEVDFRSCGTSKSRSCIAPEISGKRVRGNWEIQLGAFPVRNHVTSQVTGWTISYYYDIRIEGERRNFFKNWRRNPTRLGFETGFGIFSALFGTTTSGQDGFQDRMFLVLIIISGSRDQLLSLDFFFLPELVISISLMLPVEQKMPM